MIGMLVHRRSLGGRAKMTIHTAWGYGYIHQRVRGTGQMIVYDVSVKCVSKMTIHTAWGYGYMH